MTCLTFIVGNKNEIVTVAENKNNFTFRVGLVCAVNRGIVPEGYEILWASDGRLFTIDNGYLFTKKQ